MRAARLSLPCLAVAVVCSLPAVAVVAAPPAKPVKVDPKLNAAVVLKSGIKSADFVARGMAYRGLQFEKDREGAKKLLEDGATDPQWVVRAGVAQAFYALKDVRWRKVVHDALVMPVLSPLEVLPVLDDMLDKDQLALIFEVLGDKEHEQHDKVMAALLRRDRPHLVPLFVQGLASKDALVAQTLLKGLVKLSPVLQVKILDAIAKAHAANDVVTKALLEVAAASHEKLPTSYLNLVKTKDGALLDKVTVMRARHGDRAVAKAMVAMCLRLKDKEQLAALQALKPISSKEDAVLLKPILEQGPSHETLFQVYELLARAGDRSMQKEAENLAESTDVDVRATGVFYLGWVGGAGRIGDMHRYLQDGIPAVRIAAARVLGYIASHISVGPLKEGIELEKDERVRMEMVRALAGIRHKDAYQALMFFTREKDPELRRVVVRALADSGDAVVRQGLQNALNDNDPRIRSEAVRGFILSDVAKAVDVWKRAIRWLPPGVVLDLTREMSKTMEGFIELALADGGKDDNGVAVREEALVALHLLPEAETRILFKLLEQTQEEDLKIRILRALLDLDKAKVAVAIKSTALQSSPRARMAAIRMLGKLKGDKEAQEFLVRFLDEADERIRIAAALTILGG